MSCPRGCCATYKEHLQGIAIFGPSKQRDAVRREEADMHAFKRLVQSGVQPKGIAGAAELERGAETRHEVEHASLYTDKKQRDRITKAFESAPPPSAA